MKRFRFNLEKVLDLRRHKEQDWERKLAKINGECVLLQQQIQQRTEEAIRMMQARQQAGGTIDMHGMLINEFFIVRLKKEKEQLTDELVLKEGKREEVQAHYFLASRERKVIEKLKEKRAGEYNELLKKEEIKQIDDINNSRYERE